MITVAEAKRLVQQHIPQPTIIAQNLAEACGFTLAEDIAASFPSPRFTNSAMDGFALRFSASFAEHRGEVRCTIVGESAAGKPFQGTLREGEVIRISTGAIVPDAADTVIPQEDCEVIGEVMRIVKPFRKGQWVRQKGAEYDEGALVLFSGTVLRPAHCALAAQLGLRTLPVYAAPQVALLATGREIFSTSSTQHAAPRLLDEGQIYDANTPMLQAAVRDAGAEVKMLRSIDDTLEATLEALSEASAKADIICTTGGVSVGEHDFIKQAAQILGFETIFWRVRQKPGKPLFFAKRDNTLLFGLPGNPVSTLMCFLHYVRPTIATLLGRSATWQTITARMSKSLVNVGGRAEFLRVRLVHEAEHQIPSAVPLDKQESFMLTSLTEADGFVFVDIDANLSEGAPIEVMLF